MAKILVAGGAGFIALHVVDLFLAKATDYPQPQHGPAKVGETRHIYLDAKKAAKELGWTPTVTLGQGLEQTVSYLRDTEPVV